MSAKKAQRNEELGESAFCIALLLASVGLRNDVPVMPVKLPSAKIKKMYINSKLVLILRPPKKIPLTDINSKTSVKDVLVKILSGGGIIIPHTDSTHEDSYIHSKTGKFGTLLTNESASGKSRHSGKVEVEDDDLNKLSMLFGASTNTERVHDIAREYPGSEIIAYDPRLSQSPLVKSRALYFELQENRDRMPLDLFERSGYLIGFVWKKGTIIDIVVNHDGYIKKFDDNFKNNLSAAFSHIIKKYAQAATSLKEPLG